MHIGLPEAAIFCPGAELLRHPNSGPLPVLFAVTKQNVRAFLAACATA